MMTVTTVVLIAITSFVQDEIIHMYVQQIETSDLRRITHSDMMTAPFAWKKTSFNRFEWMNDFDLSWIWFDQIYQIFCFF